MYNNNNAYEDYYNYGMGNNYNRAPRPTKSNIEMFIANSIQVNPTMVKFSDISERPSVWKHACTQTGVTILNERVLNFYGVATIYFAICPICSKIIYYVE